jgi:hypothetical protein
VADSPWRGGRSAGPSRMVHFSRCTTGGSGSIFGWSTPYPQMVRVWPFRRSATPCRRSARSFADSLSPSLFEMCFYFSLSCDVFLGLVGPLWLRGIDKHVWESVVLTLGYSRVHLSREQFLSAPIYYTPLWSPNQSFNWYQIWLRIFVILTSLRSKHGIPITRFRSSTLWW